MSDMYEKEGIIGVIKWPCSIEEQIIRGKNVRQTGRKKR